MTAPGFYRSIRGIFSASLLLLVTTAERSAWAGVTFYTDLAQWQAAVVSTDSLPTTAASVALANEVASPPTNNTVLTSTLTFDGTNTGFSFDFEIEAVESAAAAFVFLDVLAPPITARLAVGQPNLFEDDDWDLTFTGGASVFACGFDLFNNQGHPTQESFEVYDTGGALLGSIIPPDTNSPPGVSFLGVVSTVPIGHIHFNEDTGNSGDDLDIGNFIFSTSVPQLELRAPTVLGPAEPIELFVDLDVPGNGTTTVGCRLPAAGCCMTTRK